MLDFLHSLFLPHHKNNHRAKLLHNSSLFVLILIVLFSSFALNFVKQKYPEILGISNSISEMEMLSEINKIRQEKGLGALSLNPQLSSAASQKAADMFSKNYWAHFSPDGSTSPWQFIKGAGYNYLYAGENLAKGFTSSGDVVTAWMNSPTHRDNILSNKYKDIGFAISEGKLSGEDTILVVEMFGSTNYPEFARQEDTQRVDEKPKLVKVQEVSVVESFQPNLLGDNSRSQKNQEIAINPSPLISISSASKSFTIFLISMLLFAFVMDFVIVEKRKIPRLVGHNLDHIMLVLIFLLFIFFQKTGFII